MKEQIHKVWFIKLTGKILKDGSQEAICIYRGKEYTTSLRRREFDGKVIVTHPDLPHHPCSYLIKAPKKIRIKSESQRQMSMF